MVSGFRNGQNLVCKTKLRRFHLSSQGVARHANRKNFIMNIYFDSRKVTPNSIFVAIKGNNQDGNAFIPDAIRNGATTVVHEGDLEKVPGITYIQVPDSRLALAEMAQNFYGNPS